jgi:class 3 adenylate cyclase
MIEAIIARYDGRVFNTGGDNMPVEFVSAVEAVRCAVDWQEAVRSCNLVFPPNRQIRDGRSSETPLVDIPHAP